MTERNCSRVLLLVLASVFSAVSFAAATPPSPAAACARLHIPRLGVDRCVIPGGQAEIDAGEVVEVSGLTRGSVVWVAAHRTSHGASFNSLPALVAGDYVFYAGTWYQIAQMRLVDRTAPDIEEYYATTAPRLILQTSKETPFVYTWRAEVSGPPPAVPEVPAPPAPAVSTCKASMRFGSRSPAVRELQRRLAAGGWYVSRVDGWFHVRTRAALRSLQYANGLPPTGTASPAVRELLGICPPRR